MILETVVHWIHLMAAVTWLGGMIFVSLVLQPILRASFPPEQRLVLYREVGRRFRKVQLASLGLLLATGAFKLRGLSGTPDALFSPFGAVLGVKLALVCAVLTLSVLHSFRWGPRLTQSARGPGRPDPALGRRIAFWGKVNLALAAAVVFCAVSLRFNPF